MSAPVPAAREGRLLRGGRMVARVLAVWLLAAGALALLDRWLADFAMARWWQPIVVALLFGLLGAVVWPLVLRLALPLAVFTFGIGSFLLLGAGVLAISFAVPGVVIANFRTAVVVAMAMSLVGTVASSLVAIDEDELFFRRARRRGARGGVAGGEEQPPGIVFLQVDGLGHDIARRAVRDGNMPTFAAWLAAGSHVLTHWNTDWSSQTGASVCGILHGSNENILGYRYYEKDRDHVVVCGSPEDAAEIERRHSDGRGLLSVDGAGHGNLFTGDAAHFSLTMSALPLLTGADRRRRRRDGIGAGYVAYFSNPANALRTFIAALIDIAREVSASTRQRRADVRPRVHRGGLYPFARAGTTVIARDIVVSAVIEDMLAGRACVYVDLLGYDEVAHHSGIERFDTLAVLRSIDRQIGRLHRATQLAPRRYHIVALSDHGQTQGLPFAMRFGETIEELVGRLCMPTTPPATPTAPATPEKRAGRPPSRQNVAGRWPSCHSGEGQPVEIRPPKEGHDRRSEQKRGRAGAEGWQVNAMLAEATSGGGPIARQLRARVERAGSEPESSSGAHPVSDEGAVTRVAPGVVVVVSGHAAMVSFTRHEGRVELETIEREHPDLLPALVDHDGVGFLLVRSRELGPVVFGRDGERRLATGEVLGTDPLAAYGPHAPALISRFDAFSRCPDIVINSCYDPATDDASPFEPHVGSHGGMGGPQSRGFLMHPAELPPPGEIVGAEALHRVLRGWLTHLGHPEPPHPDQAQPERSVGHPAARG